MCLFSGTEKRDVHDFVLSFWSAVTRILHSGKEPNAPCNPDGAVFSEWQCRLLFGPAKGLPKWQKSVVVGRPWTWRLGLCKDETHRAQHAIPTRRRQTFTTFTIRRPSVLTELVEGKRPMTMDISTLGKFPPRRTSTGAPSGASV